CTTSLRRNIDAGYPRQMRELLINFAIQIVAAILIHQIPFIEGDDERFACFSDHVQHKLVLLRDLMGGIDEHDAYFCGINDAARTQRSVVLVPLGIFNLLAQTRGVDKTPQLLVQLHQGVNWVNGGTRDIVNDRAFLASNLVEQGRLAHIRLAHRSNATWTSGNGSTARLFRESAQNLRQNVSASSTMQSRNGPRITLAERVERRHIGVHGIRIKFIRYLDHRYFGALQF